MIKATFGTRRDPVVFVVDGDPLAHSAISRLARQMNLPCEPFVSGTEFLAAVDEHSAGCVVSEVRIPDVAGLQLHQQLSSAGCTLPIVFHTAHPSIELAVQATRNGAVDFLEKPFKEQRMWEAIQRALQLDRTRWRRKVRNQELRNQIASLTNRELSIMVKVTSGQKNHEIAKEEGIALRTVEKVRSQLMQKLGAKTLQDLIRFELAAQCLLSDRCQLDHVADPCELPGPYERPEFLQVGDHIPAAVRI